MRKLIRRGAEANLYVDGSMLVKERVKKSYRIREIDDAIRKRRTKSEAKLLAKVRGLGVLAPKVGCVDKFSIEMEYVDGARLKDVLDAGNAASMALQLGKMIGVLHKNDIIHGDITTSNVIYSAGALYILDFGLGYFSKAVEDKAVDLHLLEEALESTHAKLKDKFFDAFCESYRKEYKNSPEVMERLKEIRLRGRYVER